MTEKYNITHYIALFATSAEQNIKTRKSKMQSNRIHANTINYVKRVTKPQLQNA